MRVPPFRILIERSLIFCVYEQVPCPIRCFCQCAVCRFSLPCSGRIVRSTGIRPICKSKQDVKKKVSAHSYFFYLPDIRMLTGGCFLHPNREASAAAFPGGGPCGQRSGLTASSRIPLVPPPESGMADPDFPVPMPRPCPFLRYSSIVNSQAHQNSSGCASGGQATQRVLIRGSTADAKWLYSSIPVVLQG